MKDKGIKRQLVVAKDGSGDFESVQQAVEAVSEIDCDGVTIYIRKGIYREKIFIDKPFVKLVGENASDTILTFDDHANIILEDGKNMGTFNSYTVFIGGDDFSAENITFQNTAGRVGQALAAYVDGDRVSFRNCRFLGYQDTIFTGALPNEPWHGNTYFRGPRTIEEGKMVRMYYEDCYISGDVDFIFGAAVAVFNRCEIYSEDIGSDELNGYITAASTPEGQDFGYVFIDCKLTSDAAPRTIYLGRPWRDHAKTVFINCWMGEHIKPEGWHNWDKRDAESTTLYGEYNSSGPGARMNERACWSKILTEEESKIYSIKNVLNSLDGWNPSLKGQEE